MKFINVHGSWYVDTEQYANLGYDETLGGYYKINTARIDYIEKDECASEPTYWIIKLADGSCIVTKETDFLKELK